MDSRSSIQKEYQFKVLVVGEYGVGKTAIIRRYTEGHYSPNYKVTIGVDFAVKTIELNESASVSLQLWDIAGHERFGTMTRVYYKYAVAAIIVYDLSRPESFYTIKKWLLDVRQKVVAYAGHHLPVLLLANKCDMDGANICCEVINEFCLQNNIDKWFATSAKENTNIEEAMNYAVQKIFEVRNYAPQASSIQLNSDPYKSETNRCC